MLFFRLYRNFPVMHLIKSHFGKKCKEETHQKTEKNRKKRNIFVLFHTWFTCFNMRNAFFLLFSGNFQAIAFPGDVSSSPCLARKQKSPRNVGNVYFHCSGKGKLSCRLDFHFREKDGGGLWKKTGNFRLRSSFQQYTISFS